jgi:hypothetical protein
MPRPRDHQKHVTEAVARLLQSVTTLLQAVAATTGGGGGNLGGNNRAGKHRSMATTAGGGSGLHGNGLVAKKRGPGKGNPKLKSKLKAYWASLTPAQRKARVARMHAWRKK